MTTGCAGALELCFSVLCEPGSNLLLPAPCYCMYNCLGGFLGVNLKYYKLLVSRVSSVRGCVLVSLPSQADCNWEADLEDLDGQIDANTRAILINNPGNPYGSVLSQENLRGIVGVARKHRLPIISDEAYTEMVTVPNARCPCIQPHPLLICNRCSKGTHSTQSRQWQRRCLC